MSSVYAKKSALPARSPLALAVSLAVLAPMSVSANEKVLPEVQVQAAAEGYRVESSANQKFTAPLAETPKSIVVIPEAVLKDSGSSTLQDALRATPGITFGGGEGGVAIGDRPFIRGFDAFASIYVDGIRDIGSQTREVFAVEQLEVLKGPSGAFDGRGSAGGSINMVTKQAKAGNFGAASLGIGTDSFTRATVDGNAQLGDNAAVRIVGMVHTADTPGRDNVDVKRQGWLASLALGLEGPTQATLSYYHHETDDVSDWGLPFNQSGSGGLPVGVPDGKPVGPRDTWYGVKGRDFQETSADIATIKLSHAINDSVKVSNTTRYGVTTNKYFVGRPNVTTDPAVNGEVDRSAHRNRGNETTSLINLTDLSVAFNTGSIKHNVNTGVEISREENVNRAYSGGNITDGTGVVPIGNSNPNATFDPVTRNPFPSAEAETSNRSIYVFDTMELTEQVLLNAGVRYDSYKSTVQNRNATTGVPSTKFENDESFFNYQLGVVYKLKPNANVYASYGTSSSPVGLSMGDFGYAGGGLGATTEDLSPERSKTYEVGTKWTVANGLDLTSAIFHTKKTNARVDLGGAVENAGEAVVNGIELGLAGKITDKWNVFGGYTYLDAEQTKVGDSADSNAVGSAASKGKQLSGIAKQSASLWTTYEVLPKLTVGGGAFYMDKVFADPGNFGFIPSWVRYDAMGKYDVTKNVDVQLNVQNLTDKRYFSNTYFRHYAVVAPGRSATLTVNVKF